MQASVEEFMRVCAAIADMHGKHNLRSWESSSAATLQTVSLVDWQSRVKNPAFSKCSDTRLRIELAALRQLLW